MTIDQSSRRAVVDWNSFSIGQGGEVRFNNGAGATLNRVTGGNLSEIMGTLKASGSLYLVNPQGVVIGESGVVVTGGSFVASTHDVPNEHFMAGGSLLFKSDSAASVTNLGTISATGGDVVLIARTVVNAGTIRAAQGTAALASGREILLKEGGRDGDLVSVRIGAADGKVENSGLVEAAQAELRAAGGNIYALAGNSDGVVRATGTADRNGRIWLTAGEEGRVVQTGTAEARNADGSGGRITVAAPNGLALNTGTVSADGTRGGKVRVKAGRVVNQGRVSADGSAGRGGKVKVAFADSYADTTQARTSARGAGADGAGGSVSVSGAGTLFSSGRHDAGGDTLGGSVDLFGTELRLVGAAVDASGATGGGVLRLGGDYQGQGDAPRARTTLVTPATTLTADALQSGSGGRIIVWSDENTEFAGTISARGGALAGDGGFVEVSSKDRLHFAGLVDAGAAAGAAGQLLLDPKNIVISDQGSYPNFQLVDPSATGQGFGMHTMTLPNGNIVVAAPFDSTGGAYAGAVYLFNGASGALISALYGNTYNAIGFQGLKTLANGNYLIMSANWGNGTVTNTGAVTWGSATAGVAGVVSPANSLVGSTSGDAVGDYGDGGTSAVVALSNGNYLVLTGTWSNGTAASAGAVTWGSGTAGVSGVVSSGNSLVGSTAGDKLGGSSTITELTNGNYVVASPYWDNGTVTDAGAVTWASGTAGAAGAVSPGNSLVGTTENDLVGRNDNVSRPVVALTNGNYVVTSPSWNRGTVALAGAATWGNGSTGITGAVGAGNSLVGAVFGDQVGSNGVTALTYGNYVVATENWTNGTIANAGAVTWGDGGTGIAGAVGAGNSLVGGKSGDLVGSNGVTALTNGNYVVASGNWMNGTIANAGAVTWGNGSTGITGVVGTGNSLVGSTAEDKVGFNGSATTGVTALINGHYVVAAPFWDNGTITDAGAVVWGNGTGGTTGVLNAASALVGTTANERIGAFETSSPAVTALTNGHYVVRSPDWDNGSVVDAGAVTWRDGTTAAAGVISVANSLVGTTAHDRIGSQYPNHVPGVTPLTNGNYVVNSPRWDNGAIVDAGAVTWGNGTVGVVGAVSSANSLVGTSTGGQNNGFNILALSNGHYVVGNPGWDNGTNIDVGAATWGNGTVGVAGAVSSSNSLVGTSASDNVGQYLVQLRSGDYVTGTSNWNNGSLGSVGAATWGNGTAGITGAVSAANSIIGGSDDARISYNGEVPGGIVAGSYNDLGSDGTYSGRVYVGLNTPNQLSFALGGANTVSITPAFLTRVLDTGTAVTLQASNDITVNSAVTVNNTAGDGGALTLQAGRSILLNANVTTDNGALTLIGNELLANGVIDAQRDAGNAVITMAGGTAIDAGTGAVSIALRAGTGKTNTATGDITLRSVTGGTVSVLNQGPTAGSDVVLEGAVTAAGSGANALVLASDNGVFTNNAGASALSAANSRFLVYSSATATTTTGGLTGGSVRRKTYATYAPGSVTQTGSQFIYADGSLLTLTLTADSLSTIYGDSPPTLTWSYSGLQGGDTLASILTGAPSLSTTAVAGSSVGGYAITIAQGGAAAGGGYDLEFTPGVLTVTPKALTAGLTGVVSKVYDGTTAATLADGNYTLSGVVTGDTVTLNNPTAGTYADAEAGTGKTVAVSGLALTGAHAGNYVLGEASASAPIGTITAAPSPPPVAPPETPPVTPPVVIPVTPPETPPVTPPVITPPVTTPVTPPVAPPVTPPETPPVTPPVVTPPVTTPVAPPETPPVTEPVTPVIVMRPPVTPPATVIGGMASTGLGSSGLGLNGSTGIAAGAGLTAAPAILVSPTGPTNSNSGTAGTAPMMATSTVTSGTTTAVVTTTTAAAPASGAGSGTGSGAASVAGGGGAATGIVTIQVSTGGDGARSGTGGASGGQDGPATAASGRIEASVNAGGFRVVYSQSARAAAGTPPVPAGSPESSGDGVSGGTALAGASSFSTFRAEERPSVAIVSDQSATATTASGPSGRNPDETTAP